MSDVTYQMKVTYGTKILKPVRYTVRDKESLAAFAKATGGTIGVLGRVDYDSGLPPNVIESSVGLRMMLD